MKKSFKNFIGACLITLGLGALPQLAGAQVQFVMAWGGNVDTVGTTPDICERVATCQKGSYSELQGHFKNPAGVAVDMAGNVYVADEYNHRIQRFDSSGKFSLEWGSKGDMGGQFLKPWGIAIDSNDNVYVVDRGNQRIQKFDSRGNFKLAWGGNIDTSGSTPDICEESSHCRAGSVGGLGGQFKDPRGIGAGVNGNVYVVDENNARIQKFDSSGNFIMAWGYNVDTSGTTPNFCENAALCQAATESADVGHFKWPGDVAVNSNGDVYVVEWGNSRVQKFDSRGNFKMTWGSKGGLGGQFINPDSVALDNKDNVYVLGRSYRTKNQRVQMFDSNGNFKLAWGGNVNTVDSTSDVCENAANCQAGSKGALGGQFNDPASVAVDRNGNVYVTDRSNHRIQKFLIFVD
jgi:tripartite motif-containing protein 71